MRIWLPPSRVVPPSPENRCNSYVTRLLRVAVAGPNSSRQMWKAAAIANGFVMARPTRRFAPRRSGKHMPSAISTPAGYAAGLVSDERDER